MSRIFYNNNIELFEDTDNENNQDDNEQDDNEEIDDNQQDDSENQNEEESDEENQNEEESEEENQNEEENEEETTDENAEEDENVAEAETETEEEEEKEEENEEDDENKEDDDNDKDDDDESNDLSDDDPDFINKEEKNELDELLTSDIKDEENLRSEDLDNIINSKFQDNPLLDEFDDEKYIKPNITAEERDDDNDLKLSDLEIDNQDNDENLFDQGGALGQEAKSLLGEFEDQGDDIAELILTIPIDLINLLVEVVLKMIGAVLEGPIDSFDQYLSPVREALGRLYEILLPIVTLINNIIGLPFSVGQFTWSIICNLMKLFGISVKCSTNYTQNTFILDMFNTITNMNIFRFKDIIYNDGFREELVGAIKMFYKKILESIGLILKAMLLIQKIIEFLIEQIKNIVNIIIEVTTEDNLLGFMITLVTIGVFYVTFYGLNSSVDLYNNIKGKLDNLFS
uniref:Uncharacterized protein n=1 Tax=viral metagenome TaxID=1070528 RepID=A0A6C0GZK0_9ZZZZ